MADEKQAQETEQEPELAQIQEEELVQEPAEAPQDGPAEKEKEKNGGILMPILYALLAAVGAFTLVIIAGIVWTILTQPGGPLAPPSSEPSTQIIQTQAPAGESSGLDAAG